MEMNTLYKNLTPPVGKVDCILDTDTYNEIDDQFALAYMLKSTEKLNVKAVTAAPFLNGKSSSPSDGMHKSYDEIIKILKLMKRDDMIPFVYKGSEDYLKDESTPIISDAAKKIAEIADNYTSEKPLYVVAIGAITNVASALLFAPQIANKIVVVWLGGHALEWRHDTAEFNMVQDIAAARVIWEKAEFLVQLPCMDVVSGFTITAPELREYMLGKNELCTYLANNTIEFYGADIKYWSKTIWDVTAVAWLLNDGERFMENTIINRHMPNYDKQYNAAPLPKLMAYVPYINRDSLMANMIETLIK